MPAIQIEVFSGRRGTDQHGRRFLLNPTPRQFADFFAGFHGAAFIRQGDDVAFAAGPDGSIDHDTTAKSFGLIGDEIFRGYIRTDGQAQIEVWIQAEDEKTITDEEQTHVDACVSASAVCPVLSRIRGPRELVVFSTEHGQAIVERELPSAA